MRNIILSPAQKIIAFIGIFAIVILIGFLCFQSLKAIANTLSFKTEMFILNGKKAVIIIAFRGFRDEEYFVLKEILEKGGVEIKTASNQKGTAIGADGGEVEIDLLVSEIYPDEFERSEKQGSKERSDEGSYFDAVVFVGGPGCLLSLDNGNSYKVTQETVSQNKILAAICISPAILAKAGVLQGKKATVWSSIMDKSAVKTLKENGAVYQDEAVVVDGKIITGNGPDAAKEFGEAVVKALQ